MVPAAEVLHVHRERSFVFGYGQMIIIASIVATGAGLHVAAYFIAHQAHIGPLATVLATAIPVGIFLGSVYAMYVFLVAEFDRFHILLLFGTAFVVALAIAAAALGLSMPVCLIILSLAPAVTIIGYETVGHKHQAAALKRDREDKSPRRIG